ncbi:MAG: glycosyltransferase family 4 protein [Spirochaetaceae bacterium]|jgi:glycosyltransferase involved in cell wall biosynthesis|nr:glycosyltransferase family 4 protein [Spirochaetaceae bacterium]
MKIGVDTFACNIGVSGVGVYVTQLLKRIPLSSTQYELFGWEFDRFAFSDTDKTVFVSAGKISGKTANSLWHVFKFPGFALSRKYDVCFFPAAHRRLPYRFPCPSVGTVHDMAAYWGTAKTREHLGAVLRIALPDSLRRLERIIAVSEWVKKELVEVAKVKESCIEVVPNGIDTQVYYPRDRGEESGAVQPFGFKQPYILYASRLHHPIKNHVTLIKAFEIFKDKTKLPHRIVFAGSDDHGADKVRAAAFASKYRGEIFFTGNFPSQSLPGLYAAASFAVIPSRYEGFGQGAIEAMASGIPVACARAAALPETADHAALYFDPLSAEDMADRMIALAGGGELYNRLKEAGIERARLFSWDRCAERTLKILQETV